MQSLTTRLIALFIFLFSVVFFGKITHATEKTSATNCLSSISPKTTNSEILTPQNTEVKIEYVTHSTFRITSPKGIIIEVDFTGVSGNGPSPNIVTLNHTPKNNLPSKTTIKSKILLEAWSNKTSTSLHHLVIKEDVSIQNFRTDVYDNGVLKIPKGNSIFVFKIADLCIAHLGNIQHTPTNEQLKSIGKLDIVMVPVSGPIDGPVNNKDKFNMQDLIGLLQSLNTKIVIPMHWENDASEQDFMAQMAPYFSIPGYPTKSLIVSTNTLPKSPTIVTMIPQYDQNKYEFYGHQ